MSIYHIKIVSKNTTICPPAAEFGAYPAAAEPADFKAGFLLKVVDLP